ncbi:MAPEG family protein [Variovorax sp. PCZ-1]|uniref:MAPEG family protein n=1 Tax=Variovorax sp. PCZ-1 TaxID=2835533 RepID=UPI001BCEB76A|nr:MAPEG family protein [Variovorax sp. PCZ-1]MBS7806834.1 MAPEG family protein [Variovorax sp. PCZ-1]
MPQFTALTGAVLALLLTGLSLHISRLRIRHRVSFGDGGHKDLHVAIRAHGNALEQSLLLLVLMLLMELVRPGWSVVAAIGGVFVAARVLHAVAIFTRQLLLRQVAHVISVLCQLTLALGLLWWAIR